jgi:hypothetical protein
MSFTRWEHNYSSKYATHLNSFNILWLFYLAQSKVLTPVFPIKNKFVASQIVLLFSWFYGAFNTFEGFTRFSDQELERSSFRYWEQELSPPSKTTFSGPKIQRICKIYANKKEQWVKRLKTCSVKSFMNLANSLFEILLFGFYI